MGGPVDVHYVPDDPAESVLRVGLEGIDLFHAMFMLPFNLIMLAFWTAGLGKILRRQDRPQAEGAGRGDDGNLLRVDVSAWQPLYAGAAVAGVLAFAGVFVVSFGFSSNPSMTVMLTAWAVIVGGGVLGCFFHSRRLP